MIHKISFLLFCLFGLCAAEAWGQPPGQGDHAEALKSEIERHVRLKARLAADSEKVLAFQQDDFDAIHYDIQLDLDVVAETISGTLGARVVALTPGVTDVTFDLMNNMTVTDVREGGAGISYTHGNDLLVMTLAGVYAAGDTIHLEIDYGGPPAVNNSELPGTPSFSFDTRLGGELVIHTISEPFFARSWWPCKDVPNDKATATLDITVPDTLVVASNGTLEVEEAAGPGRKRYYWVENYPITTYLVSLAISNYAVYSEYYHYAPNDSMEIRYFVYPERLGTVQAAFDSTAEMITAFAARFGEYPFINEKYGMAQVTFGGALEHQTCSSMGSTSEWIIAHELAHQWWGDMVSPEDWKEIWLNEGFASYSEALWQEHINGFDAYRNWVTIPGKRPSGGYKGTLYDPDELFSLADVYWRGAWVLHMLRHVMGDGPFFDALVQYRNDFAYGNATTVGFKTVCEAHYGSSLDWFFDQWVFGWSVPRYEYHWRTSDEGGASRIELGLWQTQKTGLIAMPIDIHVTTTAVDSTIKVWNNQPYTEYEFLIPGTSADLKIDPDEWIIRDLIERDITSFANINVYPNPFNAGTSVYFELNVAGQVDIAVFGASGARVRGLLKGSMAAGPHVIPWDGRNDNGQTVATGVYFVRLKTPDGRGLRKAVHVK
jgi:aminopeptidase N